MLDDGLGEGGGGGGIMFPCSQQDFPCVPMFPKSISAFLVFPVRSNILFSRVPSFIFLMFLVP